MIIGQGIRLFPDTDPDAALDLVDSRATPKGVTLPAHRAPAVCNHHRDLKYLRWIAKVDHFSINFWLVRSITVPPR